MIPTIVEHVRGITSPHSAVFLFHLGGAIGRHREEETATGNRDVEFVLNVMASWEPGAADAHVGWARALWQRPRRYSTGGVYVNFLTEEEGAERLEAAYHGTNYARLTRLKAIYDPDNLFRHNQNIKPAIMAAQAPVPGYPRAGDGPGAVARGNHDPVREQPRHPNLS